MWTLTNESLTGIVGDERLLEEDGSYNSETVQCRKASGQQREHTMLRRVRSAGSVYHPYWERAWQSREANPRRDK